MWKPTSSSSSASSSDNKQKIKEVVGVEQFEQPQQKQKNISKYPQQTATFGEQFTDSTEQKDIDLSGETSEGEGAGAVGVSGGDIKTLNIPSFLSEPQLQKHHQHQNLKYQEKQQQQDIDSGYLGIDSEQLQPKSQQHFYTDSGCIEEGDMKFKHTADAGLPKSFCSLSLENNSNNANNNFSRTNTSTSSVVVASGLNNLGAPKQQQQSSSQQKSSCSFSSFPAGQQTVTVPTHISPANVWDKYFHQHDNFGNTSLHLECISGNVDAVTAWIRMAPHPCLLNITNYRDQTPLHVAASAGQPRIVRMLLIAGAKPTAVDYQGNTALHVACAYVKEKCVEALTTPISVSEINEARRQFDHCVNANLLQYMKFCNSEGKKYVHLAAQSGSIGILRILMTYGADINEGELSTGRTPLHIAIECGNNDFVNFLLDECPTLNLEEDTYAGLTAYQFACKYNRSEMQNMLLKKGAKPLMPPDSDDEMDFDSDSTSCFDSSDSAVDLDDC